MDNTYHIRKKGLPVFPRSIKDIRYVARSARILFGLQDLKCNVVGILEIFGSFLLPEFSFEIVDDYDSSMQGKWAETFPDKKLIRVKNSVYERACKQDGQARYTLAHELGHLFLQHKVINNSFSRCNSKKNVPIYYDSEWQADIFAAEFLMPFDLVKNMSIEHIVKNCGVTKSAAETRWRRIRNELNN